MNDFILSFCSTSDVTEEKLRALDVHYICNTYTLNGVAYRDDLGKTIPYREFYDRIRKGEIGVTSLINTADYADYFEPFLKDGKDVLHVTLSSGLSSTFQSALAAAELLRERYPERKLLIVDSRGASSGYGLQMETLSKLRAEGRTIDELYN